MKRRFAAAFVTLLSLAPSAPAGAASVLTGSYSYQYELVLGDGTTCNASPATRPCSVAGSASGPFSRIQPLFTHESISNQSGADNTSAAFTARQTYAFRSQAGFETSQSFQIDAGGASTANLQAAVAIDASFHGRIVMDMTTALQPGQTTELTIRFGDENSFVYFPGDVVANAEFRLNDLTTGSTLASLSLATGGMNLNLDSDSLIGHQVELLFDGSFLGTLPSGFNGNNAQFGPTFDVDVITTLTIVDAPIPEPATGAMLALGLCAIAIARRSRAR